jgi:hypothetical protein
METRVRDLIIVLDGDDVILDTGTRKIQWLRENYKGDKKFLDGLKPSQCNKSKLVPIIRQECYDNMGFYVYSKEGTLQIVPKEGALEGISSLSEVAYLDVLSARREDHTENMREWCKKFNIADKFRNIYSVRDLLFKKIKPIGGSKKIGIAKSLGGHAFVDDPRHMPNEEVRGLACVLFGEEYKERLPYIENIPDWAELVKYAKEVL